MFSGRVELENQSHADGALVSSRYRFSLSTNFRESYTEILSDILQFSASPCSNTTNTGELIFRIGVIFYILSDKAEDKSWWQSKSLNSKSWLIYYPKNGDPFF